jgi:hypothetical protein
MNPQTRLWRRSLGHLSLFIELTGFDTKPGASGSQGISLSFCFSVAVAVQYIWNQSWLKINFIDNLARTFIV